LQVFALVVVLLALLHLLGTRYPTPRVLEQLGHPASGNCK
jgi:hypothetical protein